MAIEFQQAAPMSQAVSEGYGALESYNRDREFAVQMARIAAQERMHNASLGGRFSEPQIMPAPAESHSPQVVQVRDHAAEQDQHFQQQLALENNRFTHADKLQLQELEQARAIINEEYHTFNNIDQPTYEAEMRMLDRRVNPLTARMVRSRLAEQEAQTRQRQNQIAEMEAIGAQNNQFRANQLENGTSFFPDPTRLSEAQDAVDYDYPGLREFQPQEFQRLTREHMAEQGQGQYWMQTRPGHWEQINRRGGAARAGGTMTQDQYFHRRNEIVAQVDKLDPTVFGESRPGTRRTRDEEVAARLAAAGLGANWESHNSPPAQRVRRPQPIPTDRPISELPSHQQEGLRQFIDYDAIFDRLPEQERRTARGELTRARGLYMRYGSEDDMPARARQDYDRLLRSLAERKVRLTRQRSTAAGNASRPNVMPAGLGQRFLSGTMGR